MNDQNKVSDYVANYLVEHGVNKCFTVTGGGAMHLNDSFGHHTEIESIYNHHEQACAMGAEGYTRITGNPALVCVTSGPGTTNAITGVLGAWLDSIPMIIISGQMKLETTLQSTPIPLRQLGFQEFNIIDSIKCMTKYAAIVTDPRYISYHLEKALFLALEGRKGPVWLDIPLDIQSATVKLADLIHYDFGDGNQNEVCSVSYNPEIMDFLFNKINDAKKPVLLVGYGVRMTNSYESFISAVERLRVPVVTEWNSNDLIWNDHEYFAGRPGTIGDRGGNFVLQNSDLLIAVGCQFSIRQISYAWDNFAKNAYKIAVNIDKYELIKPIIKIDYPININVNYFLNEINKSNNRSKHNSNTNWYNWCKKINAKYPVVEYKHLEMNKPLSVYAFIKGLSGILKSKDIVVLANGAACVVGLQAIEVKMGQRVFTNAGASSMGYAIAASVGASVAIDNSDQVFCIEGDGSIQMNIQELQTIIENKLRIKIIWINNGGYHSIRQTQRSMFHASKRGYCGCDTTSGISFPSAEKIAGAYGFAYYKIDDISDLEFTIAEVYKNPGPLICEVITDNEEDFQPKLQSKLLPDGTFETPSLEEMYPFLSDKELEENRYKD